MKMYTIVAALSMFAVGLSAQQTVRQMTPAEIALRSAAQSKAQAAIKAAQDAAVAQYNKDMESIIPVPKLGACTNGIQEVDKVTMQGNLLIHLVGQQPCTEAAKK